MFNQVWEQVHQTDYGAPFPCEQVMRFQHQFKPKTVLDIGCGRGANLQWFAMHDAVVTGIDGSPTALKKTAEVLAAYPHRLDQIELPCRMPYQDNSFDAAIDIESCIQLPVNEACQVYLEARRLLKPGGVLLIKAHDMGSSTIYEKSETFYRCKDDIKRFVKLFSDFNLEQTIRDTLTGHIFREWVLTLVK